MLVMLIESHRQRFQWSMLSMKNVMGQKYMLWIFASKGIHNSVSQLRIGPLFVHWADFVSMVFTTGYIMQISAIDTSPPSVCDLALFILFMWLVSNLVNTDNIVQVIFFQMEDIKILLTLAWMRYFKGFDRCPCKDIGETTCGQVQLWVLLGIGETARNTQWLSLVDSEPTFQFVQYDL